MLPVGIEVVGACAAEPIDAEQAAALTVALAPATSTVCCPALDAPGHLTVYDLSGSASAVATTAGEDSTTLVDGLNLQALRARIAVSVTTSGDSSDSDASSFAEILRRLQECHIQVGSVIIPPGNEADRTTLGAALTVSSTAGNGCGRNKSSATSRQTRVGEPKGKSSTADQNSVDARAALHNFADVRVLWPLTPAAEYGGVSLQVRMRRALRVRA